MTVSTFGEVDGTTIQEILIKAPGGGHASVITWGAVVRDLMVPLPGGGEH